MPASTVDAPHTSARESARLAEVGPSRPPRLSCALEDLDSGAICVALDGELDVATLAKADRALRAAQSCAREIIVDLRRLEFIGATAARILLAADARARRAGGRLVVVPARSQSSSPGLAPLYRRLETRDEAARERCGREAA